MKQELKVGNLVKDKWGASSKVDEWKKNHYKIECDLFLPPMGMIKQIKEVTKYKTKITGDKKEKVPFKFKVAVIDWMPVKIPELNAETNKWELDHYNKYRSEMDINHIVLYDAYYKNLLKRKTKKTT